MLLIVLGLLSFGMWRYVLDGASINDKSNFHSVSVSILAKHIKDPYYIAAYSMGYFLNDLFHVRDPLYFVHHIFSIMECYILTDPIYGKLLNELMVVEMSVIFFNWYLEYRTRTALLAYLIMHILSRNIFLYGLYLKWFNFLVLNNLGWQIQMFRLFLFFNLYWTVKIFKKLIQM